MLDELLQWLPLFLCVAVAAWIVYVLWECRL